MSIEASSIKEIFLAASKLDPDQQRAYVEQACGGDGRRMDQVEKLLGAHRLDHHRVDQGLFPAIKPIDFPEPGQKLGPYRLLKEIGDGGFGVVFEAEQVEPFTRRVAIKVIKAGLDTRLYLRRFDDERRALAMLNHPNIAALYDGGSTDAGRPYFVMELVVGQKVTDYCKSHSLPTRERLKLFQAIGEAIEHAHQRGVIHRDLKPSNILVTVVDEKVNVKIIDFGIAKLVDETRQMHDHTAVGDFLGTPMYTSPEQARGEHVDTRSDIYSLGMVLYELIAGLPPHDPQIIKRSSQAQSLQYVSQTTPKRPSQRIKELDPQALYESHAVLRDRHAAQTLMWISSELDAIIMKAIAKDPEDRYGSVGELNADLQRYLLQQPVLARSQSNAYLFSKFIARNRLLSFGAIAAFALLCMVAVGSIMFSLRLNELLNRALTAEKEVEKSSQEVVVQAQTALLNLARSHAASRSGGQYFECIDALSASIALSPDIENQLDEYRTVASSALVLPDLRKRRLFDLPGPTRGDVAVSPDLRFVGYLDPQTKQFCIGDVERQQTIMELADGQWYSSQFDYRGPTFSPDSQYLVYSQIRNQQQQLAIWRVGQLEPLLVLAPEAISVSFREDMHQCAVTYRDGSACILTVPDWSEVGRLQSEADEPYIAWNSTSSLFYLWEENRVIVYDAVSLKPVANSPSDSKNLEWHTWVPGTDLIASVRNTGELYTWDAHTGERCETLQTSDRNRGHIIQASHSGRYLALNNWEDNLRIFDMQTRQPVVQTHARGVILNFGGDDSVFSADVQLNHVNAFDFHSVSAARTTLDLHAKPFPIANTSVALDPSGQWLMIPSRTGITFINTANLQSEFELPIPGNRPIGWFASQFILTAGIDGVLRWPVTQASELTLNLGPPTQLLSIEAIGTWSADQTGGLVLGGTIANNAVLIDQRSNTLKQIDSGDIRSCAVSPSGRWLSTGTHGYPSSTRLWRYEHKETTEQLTLDIGAMLHFSHDERWFTGIQQGICLWNVAESESSSTLSKETGDVCLTSDSSVMAVGKTNHQIDLLQMPDGEHLLTLTAPDATRLQPLAFSPDSSQLFALGRDTGYLYSFQLHTIESELHSLGLGKPTPWSRKPTLGTQATSNVPTSTAEPSTTKFTFDLGDQPRWSQAVDLYRQGQRAYFADKFTEAMDLYRQAAEVQSGRGEIENSLAWCLALYGQTQEDYVAAVSHARLATEAAPFDANNWNTLACACWRANQFDECLSAVRRSIADKPLESDPYDHLIETVALHGIGQVDEAQVRWSSYQMDPTVQDTIKTDSQYALLFELAKEVFEPSDVE